jgi:glycogenin glucosyltransferase
MVSKEVSETTCHRLTTLCDGIIHVPSISSPYFNNNKNSEEAASWDNSEYTKLNIWNLTQFDKIVYIDADAMVLSTTDELMDLDTDFAAAPDIFPPDKFNAGVLVIRPNADVFNHMLEKVNLLPSYDGGDTGFLNSFYPNWYVGDSNSRLHFGYNAQRTMYWFTYNKRPGYWNSIQNLKIIHYSSSPKPWETGASLGELELVWWSNM